MTKRFIITVYLLILFGLLFIYNATVVSSQTLYATPYRFVLLQLGWAIIGSVVFFGIYKINYKKLYSLSKKLFLLSLVFLAILAVSGFISNVTNTCTTYLIFTPCINGAHRWFYINPSPLPEIPLVGTLGFQPVELAKLSLVLFLSFRLSYVITGKIKDKDPFMVYMFLVGVAALLVFLQPNLSSTFLILGIGTLIYFISGSNIKNIMILLPIAIIIGIFMVFSSDYRKDRFDTFMQGGNDESQGYHIRQVQIALGSGGLFGVGFGQSRQKFQYLPEVASDSIFAIIGEELGIIGTVGTLLFFGYLLYQAFLIALHTDDLLGKLISVGVLSWFGLQFCINIAAMLALIPLTGMPIPLISYGGSSMVFGMAGLGLLASVSRTNNL